MVERKDGKARRIWVFDRGIVSEENLAAIRKRDGQYLTGTPRSQMKFEAELLEGDWAQVRPELEIKKVSIPQGEETYILCRTVGRREKEKAIRNRFSNSITTSYFQSAASFLTPVTILPAVSAGPAANFAVHSAPSPGFLRECLLHRRRVCSLGIAHHCLPEPNCRCCFSLLVKVTFPYSDWCRRATRRWGFRSIRYRRPT